MPRVVVQAGGLGSRLRPYTQVLPKPLMPVGDMPILEIVVRQLASAGAERITITLGHLGSLIESFFGDGAKWGVRIDYCWEDKPLGTIGAVAQVADLNGPFLVMNGDILTDMDYGEFYRAHLETDADVTISVCRRTVEVTLGVLDLDESQRVVGFREKPSFDYYASMGIYVLTPQVLEFIPKRRYYGFDMLMGDLLAGKAKAQARIYDGIWLDIGRPEDHEQATALFVENRERFLP
ncbi:MAG: NTP transferase domain-containing protein [Armatimonadota bacterium]|nr:MAG: NTP transferase domain-containing protein [Armatimonadota bacterium]